MQKQWNIINKSIKGDIVNTILKGRGIKDINHFLNPLESDLLPFELLSDIKLAKDVVLDGIKNNKGFTVFFDCDQDGISSGTIIYRYLRRFTNNVFWTINKTKTHGLSGQSLKDIVESTDILICCDSSSNDFEQHKILAENNVKVIILDHHESEKSQNAIVVNSQFNSYPNPALSGAGVCWKFVKYLDTVLGKDFADNFVDLACVGIIADVSDISEKSYENRYICFKGFNNLVNPALKVIIGSYEFNGQCVGWSIAPITNAAMRSGNNELAGELFLSDNFKECQQIINNIKEIKKEEDKDKKANISDLILQIKNTQQEDNKVIGVFIDNKDHTGIIANTLMDLYRRPIIVLHDNKEGLYSGSIRGYKIHSFRGLINKIGLVNKCEGHPNSAGIEIQKDKFPKLLTKLNNALRDVDFDLVDDVDILLSYEDITLKLIEDIKKINSITGKDFQQIKIAMENVEINNLQQMKPNHLKWEYEDIEFIYWKSADKIKDFESREGTYRMCDVMGGVQIGCFKGILSKQFIVNDYRNPREGLDLFRY